MGFRFCFHLPTLASTGRRDEGWSCWWSGRRRQVGWAAAGDVAGAATRWLKNRAREGRLVVFADIEKEERPAVLGREWRRRRRRWPFAACRWLWGERVGGRDRGSGRTGVRVWKAETEEADEQGNGWDSGVELQ